MKRNPSGMAVTAPDKYTKDSASRHGAVAKQNGVTASLDSCLLCYMLISLYGFYTFAYSITLIYYIYSVYVLYIVW